MKRDKFWWLLSEITFLLF